MDYIISEKELMNKNSYKFSALNMQTSTNLPFTIAS